jgi:transcriptional regulator with PAS, ATPase and Fis domain
MAQHLGRFERAHGGTLFLDEIGELELSLQAKLLRVLDQKEFERVGGNRIISVDVRIIAATNRDLKAALLQKSFREDLYYRLSTFPIALPPLRERLDDLPCLVEYLIHKVSKRMGVPSKLLDEMAWATLRHYRWPGNVRELENVLERAMIVSRSSIITLDDLPFATAPDQAKPKTLAQFEKKAILEAMTQNDGHQRKAAEQLGISLRTLQYRLREYGS